MNILTLLRKKEIPTETSQQIREALEKVQAELPTAREAYEAAEDTRDDLVLDGTDKDRDTAEAEAIRLERIWRDLDIVRGKLTERYDEALKREKRSDHEALAVSIVEKVRRQAEIIRKAAPIAAEFAQLAKEYAALEMAIQHGRRQLVDEDARDLRPDTLYQRIEPAYDGQIIGNPFNGLTIPGFYPDAGGKNPMRLPDMAKALTARPV